MTENKQEKLGSFWLDVVLIQGLQKSYMLSNLAPF